MLKSCPRFRPGEVARVSVFRLERESFRGNMVGDAQAATRGWKLFALIPMMLPPKEEVATERKSSRDKWTDLVSQAQQHHENVPRVHLQTDEDDMELRGHAAMAKIQAGQVFRAATS